MLVTLRKLIAETKKKMAKASATKKKALSAQLSHYEATLQAMKKTKYKLEEEETVEDDEEEEAPFPDREEDDMPGDEPKKDDDEEEEEERAEGDDEDERAEDDEDEARAEGDDDEEPDAPKKGKKAKKSEEEERAIAKAMAALSPRVRGALMGRLAKAEGFDRLQADVVRIKHDRVEDTKKALIGKALRANRITAQHAKMLEKESIKFVRGFLDMHKTALFNTHEDAFIPLDKGNPSGSSDPRVLGNYPQYSEEQMAMFRRTVAASAGKLTLKDAIAAFEKSASRPNGLAVGPKLVNGTNPNNQG